MTREVTLQDRAKQIFKVWLTPYMVEKGFKKNGRIYSKSVGRMLHVADIEQSFSNRKESISFTLNCGVHIPGVWSHFTKGPEPTKIEAVHGIVYVRPGLACVPKRHVWWDMNLSDGLEKDVEVGQDLRSIVEEGAFQRFFDRFQSETEVAEFLSQPRTKADQQIRPFTDGVGCIYAGIIWDQLGEYEKCKACMDKAAELAKGRRLEVKTEQFAREYVPGKLGKVTSGA